jgi:hypothetical protein
MKKSSYGSGHQTVRVAVVGNFSVEQLYQFLIHDEICPVADKSTTHQLQLTFPSNKSIFCN